MAFTPFGQQNAAGRATCCCRLVPFTETSGQLINMEGRLQSFPRRGTRLRRFASDVESVARIGQPV